MSGWTRPKPKMYERNIQIQASLYRPTLSILEKKTERSSINQSESSSEEQQVKEVRREQTPPKKFEFYPSTFIAGSKDTTENQYTKYMKSSEESLMSAKKSLEELEERQFPQREPLWKVHPYYVPEDTRSVAPHESSVWPENRKHFDLVSSYDCMVGFLGIRGMAEREMDKKKAKAN